ncbi:MAG: FecR family protein [Sideroxyarcus sp.]|nr:FecR family protein [Sideroxyarcus sp.]
MTVLFCLRPFSHFMRLSFLISLAFSLAFFCINSRANDLELMEALNAVMMGNPTPEQDALVVFRNRQINQISLRGKISDAAYQAAQKHFSIVNNTLIEDAALAGGLKANLQPNAGGKYNKGTDTDVLVEGLERGKKINLDNIKATEEAYQRNLRRYLSRRGVNPPPGKINTDTDFMPTRSSVTDAEFRRINQHINANGGTAYVRPGAAEVEYLMRIEKNLPGQKLTLPDTGDYINEMRDLAGHKFELARDLELQAKQLATSNPEAAEGLISDAQLLRSQGAKYLQRMDNVSEFIAKQHELPVIKPATRVNGAPLPSDSLDSAIGNINKQGRGTQTAGDAEMVGEFGELGIGKGLLNYSKTLARLAANKPSLLQEVQVILAEQAASLSPSMSEALILRSIEAYKAAGGTDLGSKAFARNLVKLANDPAARSAARASAGMGPFELPASIAATARVAGAVSGALTVATVYLDYQACIDAGKPKAQCDEELQHTLKTTVFVAGSMFATAKGLIALGIISQPTLVAVGAGMAILTLPMSVYAAYSAGINWAEAPEKTALTQMYANQKDVLMRFGQSAASAQSQIDLMLALRVRAAAMCGQLNNRGKASRQLVQTSVELVNKWSTALGKNPTASDTCEGQGERMGHIFDLAKKSRENETKAIQQLDEAVALGEHCKSAAQAVKIRQLLESSQLIAAQMSVDAAQARGDNNRIGHQDQAELEQRLAAAQLVKNSVLANKEHLASYSREMKDLRDDMHLVFAEYVKARAAAVSHMGLITTMLPDHAPSGLYQMEYFDANAKESILANEMIQFPEKLTCPAGESEMAKIVTSELIATKNFSDFDARQITLRNETTICEGVKRQDSAVEGMDASANWVQAAVEINSPLFQKADACEGKTPSAAPEQCTANAASVWNADQQKNVCQCVTGFVVSEDKKTCVPKNEPVTIACNTTTKAGTNPPQTIIVNVGRNAGTAHFQFQMFDVPDQMTVLYGGQTLADTGCVSHTGNVALALSGEHEQVTIVVNPACRKSEQTQWNFTLSCPSLEPTGASANQTLGGRSQLLLVSVTGHASITAAAAASSDVLRHALLAGISLTNGALLQTGANGQVIIKSPQNTQVTMEANSQMRLGDANPVRDGRQHLTLLQGTLNIIRQAGIAGFDDVLTTTPDGTVQATGTRYRMTRDERGTEVFVFEGTGHLTGRYIYRTYASNVEAGKPSPVRVMDLHAGEQALIANTDFSSPENSPIINRPSARTPSATSEPTPVPIRVSAVPVPDDDRLAEVVTAVAAAAARPVAASTALTRADPWNEPRVQQLMDQWLRTATPPLATGRAGAYSYSDWGQIKGPGITIAGAPDHPAGWSRYQSMWAVRMKFDSLNLCTLGEFIERQIANKSMDGCNRAVNKPAAAHPSWLAPAAAPAPQPASNRAEEALTLARTEVTRRELETRVVQDFSGEWACTIREGSQTSALYPSITRSGAGYAVETMTSGMEGMLNAHAVRVEGAKLIATHRLSNGSMILTLTGNGTTLSGSYQEKRPNQAERSLPVEKCERTVQTPTAVAAPAAKISSLFDRIEAIPSSDWVGDKPAVGRDQRPVFALVAEVFDKRTNACAYEARRKGWTVVGFSSRQSLQHAQYPAPPAFPLILGYRARDTIYAIHGAAGRSDVPIPFGTAYLIDTSGRVSQNGPCQNLVGIDFGISEGRK